MVFIPSQSVLAPGSGSWAFVFSDFNKGSFEVLRMPFSLSESSKSFSILQEKKRGGGYQSCYRQNECKPCLPIFSNKYLTDKGKIFFSFVCFETGSKSIA